MKYIKEKIFLFYFMLLNLLLLTKFEDEISCKAFL